MLAHVAFHVVAAAAFVVLYGYSARILALHFVLSIGLVTALMLVMGVAFVLLHPLGDRASRAALAVVPVIYTLLFASLYLTNLATNYAWGSHVTYALVSASAAHLRGLAQSFPALAAQAAMGLVVVAALLAYVYARSAPRLVPAFAATFGSAEVRSPARRRAERWGAAGALVYLVAVTLAVLWNYNASSVGIWSGDPIVSLLVEENELFDSSPKRVALAARDKVLRAQYAAPLEFDRRNVVVIVVDALRPASLPMYGYERNTAPFLSSLHAEGLLRHVAWASSPCSASVCGIMATFTSKDFLSMSHASLSLHNILRDQGYRVSFLLAGDHHWYGLNKLYEDSIDYYRDGRSECPYGINDDRCVLHFLDALPPSGGRPELIGIHLMSAHSVGVPLAEWQRYLPESRQRLAVGSTPRTDLVNGYDNGVLQADAMIAQIFERLRRRGLLENSLIVISADHGEGLGEHGLYGHTNHIYEEFIRIPLLIYDPRGTTYRNLEYASALDVAPTILAVLGIPAPETWQGRSLTLPPPERRYTFHQTTAGTPWRAVLAWEHGALSQYVVHGEPSPENPTEELRALRPGHNGTLPAGREAALHDRLRAMLRDEMY